MIYLGGLLTDDGTITSELSRRVGMAYSDFSSLPRVWSHANITRKRKIQIFNACIISKLMYGLDIAWLRQNDLARLDAFQARTLRRICGIQHSFYSRISNEYVLRQACSTPLSNLLLQRQLMLFGRIACNNHDLNLLRAMVFKSTTSYDQASIDWQRKRGRPRLSWITEVHKLALHAANGRNNLHELLRSSHDSFSIWSRFAKSYQQASSIDWSCSESIQFLSFSISILLPRHPCRPFVSSRSRLASWILDLRLAISSDRQILFLASILISLSSLYPALYGLPTPRAALLLDVPDDHFYYFWMLTEGA